MSKTPIAQNRLQKGQEKSFFVSVFLGTLSSLFIGILLLLFSCLLCLSMEDPERAIPILALICLLCTSLFSGYLSARAHRENGFLCGLLSGIFLVGILIIFAFAFSFSIRISLFGILSPTLVISSAIAGICGVSAKRKAKNKRKKKF